MRKIIFVSKHSHAYSRLCLHVWLSSRLLFQSDSTVTITCANGKWNKQVSCEPVDCGMPDKYHVHPAHFKFPEGTTYGKKITFQCREPAQLVGEMQSGASSCRERTFMFRLIPLESMILDWKVNRWLFSDNCYISMLIPYHPDKFYIMNKWSLMHIYFYVFMNNFAMSYIKDFSIPNLTLS